MNGVENLSVNSGCKVEAVCNPSKVFLKAFQ